MTENTSIMGVTSMKALVLLSVLVVSSLLGLSHGDQITENLSDPTLQRFGVPITKPRRKSPPPVIKSPPPPPLPVKSPPPPGGLTSGQYGMMQYVLQWPPTFCIINSCKPNIRKVFSIHGLWPSNSTGHTLDSTLPPFRRLIEYKNVNNVMNNDHQLEADLDIIWPNLALGLDNREFWKHEWWKHGVCSRASLSCQEYFKAAINVQVNLIARNNKRNMLDYFHQSGIRADRSYTEQDIISAVQGLVGPNNHVYLSCHVYSNNTKIIYLKEIYLCLDPTVNSFISCPVGNSKTSCPKKMIEFPM